MGKLTKGSKYLHTSYYAKRMKEVVDMDIDFITKEKKKEWILQQVTKKRITRKLFWKYFNNTYNGI